jgi:transcription elongation factor Elf1
MLLDTLLRRKPRPKAADTTHRCPLCGRGFTTSEAAACPTCPIAERCGLVMCPGCGYEFPPS